MTKQELEKQLLSLQLKWKGKVPRSNDPLFWSFKCDRCKALRIRAEIENFDTDPVNIFV
jgi:hypothetical protein